MDSNNSNINNSKYNLKIASADVGDELRKRRMKLMDQKMGPRQPDIMDQLPEVDNDKSDTSSD